MKIQFWQVLGENWDKGDTIFVFTLLGSVLVMLYAITLMNNKIRLLESELQSIRKDQSVMSDELELVATVKGGTPTKKRV